MVEGGGGWVRMGELSVFPQLRMRVLRTYVQYVRLCPCLSVLCVCVCVCVLCVPVCGVCI